MNKHTSINPDQAGSESALFKKTNKKRKNTNQKNPPIYSKEKENQKI